MGHSQKLVGAAEKRGWPCASDELPSSACGFHDYPIQRTAKVSFSVSVVEGGPTPRLLMGPGAFQMDQPVPLSVSH